MARKPKVDKDAVLKGAVEIINGEGIESLTMTRLAEHLGIKIPTLYNHIDGLPTLMRELSLLSVNVLNDRLNAALLGKSGPQAVLDTAQAYRSWVKEAPDLYLLGQHYVSAQSAEDLEVAEAQERLIRVALSVVASFGLSGDDALHAVRALRSLAHGFATLEVAEGFGIPLDCDESFRRLIQMFITSLAPHPSLVEK